MRLGLNWCNVTNEVSSANDGNLVGYLDAQSRKWAEFERCDPKLYHRLKVLRERGKRSIAELERSQLLPATTKYFSEPLPSSNSNLSQRARERTSWFERSQQVLSPVHALFLDPDSGIQTPTVRKAQADSVKYAILDEIQSYFGTCPIVIVYNHRDRAPVPIYRQKFIDAQSFVGKESLMRVLRFKRFSIRDYVFFYRKEHSELVQRLFNILTHPPFDFLFGEFLSS